MLLRREKAELQGYSSYGRLIKPEPRHWKQGEKEKTMIKFNQN